MTEAARKALESLTDTTNGKDSDYLAIEGAFDRLDELEVEIPVWRQARDTFRETSNKALSDLSKSQKWILQQTKDLSKSREREKRLRTALSSIAWCEITQPADKIAIEALRLDKEE